MRRRLDETRRTFLPLVLIPATITAKNTPESKAGATALAKFRGMGKQTFYLHFKECKFRFNHWHDGLREILLESCRERPIWLS